MMAEYPSTRRHLLRFLNGITIVLLVGCFRKTSASGDSGHTSTQAVTTSTRTEMPGCVVYPQQTEGPYFIDEELNRSDIRLDPTDSSVKPGVPLKLQFRVSQVSGDTCIPLADAIVDVWHCDASGVYSGVNDRNFNTVGQRFLRGSQLTDANGIAQFITIYPGWYPGRTVHIHFKIRSGTFPGGSYEFTSQLYFDDALSDRIYAEFPYNVRGQRTIRNQSDGIFRNDGDQLILQLTEDGEGYTGRFDMGIETA